MFFELNAYFYFCFAILGILRAIAPSNVLKNKDIFVIFLLFYLKSNFLWGDHILLKIPYKKNHRDSNNIIRNFLEE